MPWQPEDAPGHTHKADTPHLCSIWSEVANKVLVDTGDEGRAVRTANAAVAKARRNPTRGRLAPFSVIADDFPEE